MPTIAEQIREERAKFGQRDFNYQTPKWIDQLEDELGEMRRRLDRVESRFPKNSYTKHLVREGHIHKFTAGGALTGYDYIIDDSYSGLAGLSVFTATGHEAKLYGTIQAAFEAANAAGIDASFLICEGTYQEQVTTHPSFAESWKIDGVGKGTRWQATDNGQILWSIGVNEEVGAGRIELNNIWFDLQSFTGCKALDDGLGTEVYIDDCEFATGGSTTSIAVGLNGLSYLSVTNCGFRGAGIGIRTDGLYDAYIAGNRGLTGFFSGIFLDITAGQGSYKILGNEADGIRITGAANPTNSILIIGNEVTGISFVSGAVHGLVVSDNNFRPDAAEIALDFSGLTIDSHGITVTGNNFRKPTLGSADAVVLDANMLSGVLSNNTFYEYALVDCITGTAGASFQVFHNETEAGALADAGSPVGHLPSTGVAAVVVEEDNSVVSAGASTIDFTEPDATLTSVTGSAPTQEVDVNMALYALLSGRSGGQTLIGGTAASNNLVLQSTSHATRGQITANDNVAINGRLNVGSAAVPGSTIRAIFRTWGNLGAGTSSMAQVHLTGTQTANSTNRRGFEFIGDYDLDGFNLTDFYGLVSTPILRDQIGTSVVTNYTAQRGGIDCRAVATDAHAFDAVVVSIETLATNTYGYRARNQGTVGVTNAYGVYVEDQSGAATSNIGVYIGLGATYSLQLASTAGTAASGITFGTDTNLYRSGAGVLKTDDKLWVAGDFEHDGDNLGFYGIGPIARPSAYTQTYSTADKTHANPTATALTDNSGGTAGQTLAAITGGGAACENATKDAVASLADEVNKLIADMADVKQLSNSIIDDLQSLGLVQ